MSLKRNLLANYLGQAYAAVIGIAMVPAYVRFMGAEAYGLVGFFAMLQAWSQVLDLGLTPTLSRELSRFRAGVVTRTQVASVVRSAEWFFATLGLTGALVVALAAGWIARDWLKPQHLSLDELILSVGCMGGIMAPRWLVGLYRSGLAGLENMVVLNAAGTLLATLRSVGVLAVLVFWSTRPSAFFAYQLVVALLELMTMKLLFYRAFEMKGTAPRPNFRSLRRIVGMAGSMAFLVGLWIVIGQMDRLVLSSKLDLNQYGFFTVAVTLAGAINLLAAPLAQALQPRLSVLAAEGNDAGLTKLYRTSTQLTGAVVFAVAGAMACFAGPLLLAWTGDPETAREAALVLPLYALGNAAATLLALAFLIQFAHGKLRWHVIGNCLFALVWIPGVYLAALEAGPVGVGWLWLGGNVAYLLLWLPYVHHRLVPGLWWRWLGCDIGMIVLVEAAALALFSQIPLAEYDRLGVFAGVALLTIAVAVTGLLAGAESRSLVFRLCGSLLAADVRLKRKSEKHG